MNWFRAVNWLDIPATGRTEDKSRAKAPTSLATYWTSRHKPLIASCCSLSGYRIDQLSCQNADETVHEEMIPERMCKPFAFQSVSALPLEQPNLTIERHC
jgi:hypothetical protein